MENKKTLRKNTIILGFITIIVLYFVLKDDFNNIMDTLLKVDLKFIFIAVVLYFLQLMIRRNLVYGNLLNIILLHNFLMVLLLFLLEDNLWKFICLLVIKFLLLKHLII